MRPISRETTRSNIEESSRGTIRKRDGRSRLLRGGRNLGEEVRLLIDAKVSCSLFEATV